jgi:hypothetical protein
MEKILHQEKILEIKNFLDSDYCKDLIAYLDNDQGDAWAPICFPGVLGANVGSPTPTETISTEDMGKIREKMHKEVEDFMQKKVKNVTMSGHKFPVGSFAEPHSDSNDEEGEAGAWQMNKYASILYLNKDYSGGEVYFPQHDVEISPEAGSLLVFQGSPSYLHGVKEITSGDRFTILAFWDNEDSKYSKEFLDEKANMQKEALDYVESNHDYGDYNGKSFGKQNPEDLYTILGE